MLSAVEIFKVFVSDHLKQSGISPLVYRIQTQIFLDEQFDTSGIRLSYFFVVIMGYQIVFRYTAFVLKWLHFRTKAVYLKTRKALFC